MKLLSIVRDGKSSLGVRTEFGILDIKEAASLLELEHLVAPVAPVAWTIDELIEGGIERLEILQQFAASVTSALTASSAATLSGKSKFESALLSEDSISIGPAVSKPGKIICVGTNYRRHAIEANLPIPKTPVLFSKFNNALAGHLQVVEIPKAAKKIDYEVELVIVMGKQARNVSEEDASSCIFGYATGNDLSARDLQFTTSQWLLGKTCDGFAPVGPYVVTADEIADPNHLHLSCKVNGEIRQSSNTKDMIFNCASLISYISRHMTLEPGDLIFTGTPEGVILGYPEGQQKWLQSGDEIEVSVEGLGTLRTILE